MNQHHPNFLPDEFTGFKLVEGDGVGAGTVTTFTVDAGGRRRDYRMTVAEQEPAALRADGDAQDLSR